MPRPKPLRPRCPRAHPSMVPVTKSRHSHEAARQRAPRRWSLVPARPWALALSLGCKEHHRKWESPMEGPTSYPRFTLPLQGSGVLDRLVPGTLGTLPQIFGDPPGVCASGSIHVGPLARHGSRSSHWSWLRCWLLVQWCCVQRAAGASALRATLRAAPHPSAGPLPLPQAGEGGMGGKWDSSGVPGQRPLPAFISSAAGIIRWAQRLPAWRHIALRCRTTEGVLQASVTDHCGAAAWDMQQCSRLRTTKMIACSHTRTLARTVLGRS
jgi:hypothetical protein